MRTKTRTRRRSRWGFWVAGIVLLVILAPAGGLWLLWSAAPAYWAVLDPDDPDVRRGGQAFEQRVTSQMTRVRPGGETWRLRVEQEQVNQWLAARLPMWLANQGADERAVRMLRHPMVVIREGEVEAAVRADVPGVGTILRLRYEPVAGEDGGPMRLVLRAVRAGRLPVSVNYLREKAAGHAGALGLDEASREEVATVLRELESIELTVPLGDGRRVHILGAELTAGGADLLCRTMRTAAE